jgi:hypothetical protein
MNEVDAGRDRVTPASGGGAGFECVLNIECVLYTVGRGKKESRREEEKWGLERSSIFTISGRFCQVKRALR